MPSTVSVSAPVRALLTGAIDYAGLFPPANLDLTRAVEEYLSIGSTDERWALGRFVAPVPRLVELRELARQHALERRGSFPIRLSVLIGADVADEVDAIDRWSQEPSEVAIVEAVEVKAHSPAPARAVLAAVPPRWIRYLEVEPGAGLAETLDLIRERGAFAKLRTGGVTADAFPGEEAVLDFLEGCARRRLPFKATAGLHHPIRGEYRLTYSPGAPTATMYGYLNLFAAAALLWTGHSRSDARDVLLGSDFAAFRLDGGELRVLGRVISAQTLADVRAEFVHGFGSCSFREPLDELASLGRG